MNIQLALSLDVQTFTQQVGYPPNLLLVAPNAELELNSAGIKANTTFRGMRVVLAEIGADYVLAYTNDKS